MSDFQIIPVIDILDGIAVHAKRGQRDQYRPVQSVLCPDADPHRLIVGMASLRPFQHIYVADLNAILGRGAQTEIIEPLTRLAELWLDQGVSSPAAAAAIRNATVVVGSESLADQAAWDDIRASTGDDRLVLSLDFDPAGGFLGPQELWRGAQHWPSQVIVMTLARVGSGEGPDLDRLAQARSLSPSARIFAAGGVRGQADIQALSEAGYAGALVASAFHDGSLG